MYVCSTSVDLVVVAVGKTTTNTSTGGRSPIRIGSVGVISICSYMSILCCTIDDCSYLFYCLTNVFQKKHVEN